MLVYVVVGHHDCEHSSVLLVTADENAANKEAAEAVQGGAGAYDRSHVERWDTEAGSDNRYDGKEFWREPTAFERKIRGY